MHFAPNSIYHIYNQGNNRQRIFFSDANYLFFLRKMRVFLLPYADVLCYCLMPNHFHWLVYVRETTRRSNGVTKSHPVTGSGLSNGVTQSRPVTTNAGMRTFNESIGILLRSYTRAVNKQQNRSGALFREETKAKDGWETPYLSPTHPDYGKTWRNWEIYGSTCFGYIHNNPVAARLVGRADEWDYSSAKDFAGLRQGTLCNRALARELLFLM